MDISGVWVGIWVRGGGYGGWDREEEEEEERRKRKWGRAIKIYLSRKIYG